MLPDRVLQGLKVPLVLRGPVRELRDHRVSKVIKEPQVKLGLQDHQVYLERRDPLVCKGPQVYPVFPGLGVHKVILDLKAYRVLREVKDLMV